MQTKEESRCEHNCFTDAEGERNLTCSGKRDESNAGKGEHRRGDVVARGSLLRNNPCDEGHHDGIRARKERSLRCRGELKARCVEQVCRREHEADYRASNEHLSVKALRDAFMENDEQQNACEEKANAHKPSRRKHRDGVFDDANAEAPNGGGAEEHSLISPLGKRRCSGWGVVFDVCHVRYCSGAFEANRGLRIA